MFLITIINVHLNSIIIIIISWEIAYAESMREDKSAANTKKVCWRERAAHTIKRIDIDSIAFERLQKVKKTKKKWKKN